MRKIPAFDCRTEILKLWTKFGYSFLYSFFQLTIKAIEATLKPHFVMSFDSRSCDTCCAIYKQNSQPCLENWFATLTNHFSRQKWDQTSPKWQYTGRHVTVGHMITLLESLIDFSWPIVKWRHIHANKHMSLIELSHLCLVFLHMPFYTGWYKVLCFVIFC